VRLKGHLGLWLITLAGLLLGADLPAWLLWSPLALAVAGVVFCAARLPRVVAPLLALAGVAAVVAAHAPGAWTSFAVALAVGSTTLGATARARLRPGVAVLLASVPLAAWVVSVFLGPERAALEGALRAQSAQAESWWLAWAAKQSVPADAMRASLHGVTETMVLLLPSLSLVQVVPLMAWGYRLAHAALDGTRHALEPLPPFSWLRLPDGAVWVLCLGLFLLVTRQAVVHRLGLNLIAVMAAAYFCQGLAVMTFMSLTLRSWWMVAGAVAALVLLLVLTPFAVFTCVLGLADVWLDFRRLQPRPGSPGPA